MDKDDFKDIQISRIMTNQLGVEVGVISLNRPEVLNALNYAIVQGVQEQLQRWAVDDTIEMVIIKGNGPKAYCAGGDIKALFDAGNVQFLAEEYRLDEALYRYPKPVLQLLHGFVMGGGMGLMASGALRFCTRDAEFSMPETAIGFFPDVGYRYHLARMPLGLGAWLGLSGARFKAPLALRLGVVDAVLPFTDRRLMISKLYEFISAWSRQQGSILNCLKGWAENLVDESANTDHTSTPDASTNASPVESSETLDPNHEWLEAHLPKPLLDWTYFFWSLPEMPWCDDFQALIETFVNKPSDFFTVTPAVDLSPLSLAVTSMLLRRAATQSLEDVFNEDYWCAAKLYKNGDLREGILAKVIERRPAHWQLSLGQVFSGASIKPEILQEYEPPKVIAAVMRKKIEWSL